MAQVTNLRSLKNKIRTIENLKKITRAMQMVAAARLRKSQDRLLALRSYEKELSLVAKKIVASMVGSVDEWTKEKESEKICRVVFSSDKGLCGTYNSQLNRFIEDNLFATGSWISCGKKATNFLKKKKEEVLQVVDTSKELTEKEIFELAGKLLSDFRSGKYKKIEVVYTRFVNVVNCKPAVATLLPIKIDTALTQEQDIIFEPEPRVLFDDLIPYKVSTSLFLLYSEAVVSEHASRMNAMQKATDNTEDLIKNLVLIRNKVRQANITKELLDIVTGAEALK